jgi:pyridoxal phosphate enzyme (YggS family)
MHINQEQYLQIRSALGRSQVTLVAVSKTKPVSDILGLYELGQRDFGENYVQELVEKQSSLPADIRWHFIGHLQSNKVKYIAPFVHLIQGIDSLKLLKEVNKQAAKFNRVIDVLLQVHIASEETKFGLDEQELLEIMDQINKGEMANVQIKGLMGMASFTTNEAQVKKEFAHLKNLFDECRSKATSQFDTLSMGMSADYGPAIEAGSNMVRIGSLLFGERK